MAHWPDPNGERLFLFLVFTTGIASLAMEEIATALAVVVRFIITRFHRASRGSACAPDRER